MSRDLSIIELDMYRNGTLNNCLGAVTMEGYLDIKLFEDAAKQVMQAQPALQRTIIRDGDRYMFLLTEKVVSVTLVISSDWEVVAKEELQIGFKEGELLWRLVLVKSHETADQFTFFLIFNHTIGDGLGGTIVIDGLLRCYQGLRESKPISLDKRESLPDLLTLQKLSKYNSGFSSIQTVFDTHNTQKESDLSGAYPYPGADFDLFKCRLGSKPSLRRLVEISRLHRATIGSILFVAANWAIAKNEWRHRSQAEQLRVNMMIDVNERNRVDPPLGLNDMSFLISMVPYKSCMTRKDRFWFSVGKVQEILKTRVGETLAYNEMNKYNLSQGKQGWLDDANFSSVGKYPFSPVYGDIRIDHIHWLGSGWTKNFERYTLLSNSIDAMSYSIVYSPEDEGNAEYILTNWTSLVESIDKISDQYSLEDFLVEK